MLFTLLLSLMPPPSSALKIQILHTNDLHASLKTAGAPAAGDFERGGWAHVMDRLTAQGKAEGMETIRLDAGDFLEGTLAYFPDHGRSVFQAFQSMGYDATALGNHEWLMGARSLNTAFQNAPFPFPVLAANVEINPELKFLKETIKPHLEIERQGVRIGIFGITTDESFYSWIPRIQSKKNDLKILKYNDKLYDEDNKLELGIVNKEVESLSPRNDIVIGLTHIGIEQDKKLVKGSTGIDLIVGGHSHTKLDHVLYSTDLDDRKVPIVHAGSNGEFVGQTIMEIKPGFRAQLISFRLIPVSNHFPQDQTVKTFVDEAETKVNLLYHFASLDEVIGVSKTTLTAGDEESRNRSYSHFVVNAMKWATQAEVAMDFAEFHGSTAQPAGPVTRRTLMELYPRKFESEQNPGLAIYRCKMRGAFLTAAIQYAHNHQRHLEVAGITYDEIPDGKTTRLRNFKIQGRRVCPSHYYTMAVPEISIRGIYSMSKFSSWFIRGGKTTGITIWGASERYLELIKTIEEWPAPIRPKAK